MQYLHPDCSAHDGYALVPPVLADLTSLQSLRLHINSGQRVDLTPAAAIPDISLVLTLAHYERTPFNRCAQHKTGPAASDQVLTAGNAVAVDHEPL